MMKIKWTYQLARAAAQDEGNRNMKRNGRSEWNEDDYNAASNKLNSLVDCIDK
jgi:hypothetical protein